jgi:osmotically-inducible protein OsmY
VPQGAHAALALSVPRSRCRPPARAAGPPLALSAPSDTWIGPSLINSRRTSSYRGQTNHQKEKCMLQRLALAVMVASATVLGAAGCAVERHQETVGAYVDDTTITTKVKAKFADDPTVSAMAIKVDTMKGVVQLSGFAKSSEERMMAERLARDTSGVQGVRNDIVVRTATSN